MSLTPAGRARRSRARRRRGQVVAVVAAGAVAALLACALTACAAVPAETARCAADVQVGELVITEVFADPQGPDQGREWFELFNSSTRELSLRGLTLLHSRADGSRSRSHVLADAVLAPGGYLALGNAPADLIPPYVGYGYAADLGELYNSGDGKLAVACGELELDAASYRSPASGSSLALDGGEAPDATGNDEVARWCRADGAPFEPDNFGTPGQANGDCEVVVPGRCTDAGGERATVAPAPGDLVITELMPNPAKVADATGEWIELEVRRDVDLNGVRVDRLGDSAPAAEINAEACLRVTAGTLAVLARSRDQASNGGLPRVDALLPIALVSGSRAAPADVQLLVGATVLDAVSWSRSASGRSLALDPDFVDPEANDDERVFCDGVTPYGDGDRGSPGQPNGECVILPPPGSCTEDDLTRPIAAPGPAQLVITELMANPAGTDSEEEWFEVKNTGTAPFDLNGLAIDREGDAAAPRAIVSAACKPVPPGGYAVLARSADPAKNAGLPRVDATYALASSDAGNLRVLAGDAVLDAVSWSDAPDAASAQLDRAFTSAFDNDLESHFCPATQPYGDGRNLGSPGAANLGCP